jgi:diguanylate cyclase (GGDEF)-like protein
VTGDGVVARLLRRPDPTAVEIGAGGERLVAKTRVYFFATLWTIPAILIFSEERPEVAAGLAAATVFLLLSAVLLAVIQRGWRPPLLPYLTAGLDVTGVTATLVVFALIGRPHVAVNSMVVWEVYLLAIVSTSLRLDARVCLFGGGLAMLEYLALVLWVSASWNVYVPDPLQISGRFTWGIQVARFVLLAMATLVAVAIVLRTQRVMHLSGTDALTGLANRTYLGERLQSEVARALRAGRPLVVALLDIDRFKQFNDRWGHATGDRALQTVARVLQEAVRQGDLVARWGGEEFLVVLPECGVEGALRQLSRIRERLAATALATPEDAGHLTLSGGVAALPDDGVEVDGLVAVADRRLLAAKARGRDRDVANDEEAA